MLVRRLAIAAPSTVGAEAPLITVAPDAIRLLVPAAAAAEALLLLQPRPRLSRQMVRVVLRVVLRVLARLSETAALSMGGAVLPRITAAQVAMGDSELAPEHLKHASKLS